MPNPRLTLTNEAQTLLTQLQSAVDEFRGSDASAMSIQTGMTIAGVARQLIESIERGSNNAGRDDPRPTFELRRNQAYRDIGRQLVSLGRYVAVATEAVTGGYNGGRTEELLVERIPQMLNVIDSMRRHATTADVYDRVMRDLDPDNTHRSLSRIPATARLLTRNHYVVDILGNDGITRRMEGAPTIVPPDEV